MKNLIISLMFFLGISLIYPVGAMSQCCQNQKSACNKNAKPIKQTVNPVGAVKDSLKVFGACGMCKTRIEKAASSVKGVTSANWNSTKNMLVYSYNGIVKKQDVSNALIKVGHDTEMGKAQDDVYNKLPGCCKYRN